MGHLKCFRIVVIIFVTIYFVTEPLAHASLQNEKQRVIVSDDFVKNRPRSKRRAVTRKGPRTYRLASRPRPSGETNQSTIQLGLTVWKLQPILVTGSRANQNLAQTGRLHWISRRVESGAKFRKGDFLRLSIESPRAGYLYVINRDLLTDGGFGEKNFIFPTRGEDNRLESGKLIDIPAENQNPFKADPSPDQAGELLTIIVTSAPLPLPLSTQPLPISRTQLLEWEAMWGGDTEWFELEGGVGRSRTKEEQLAASTEGSRQLTRTDPGPQTIFVLTEKSTDGLLFNLMLSYVR